MVVFIMSHKSLSVLFSLLVEPELDAAIYSGVSFVEIPEAIQTGTARYYHALMSSIEEIEDFKTAFETLNKQPFIIGVFTINGLQHCYERDDQDNIVLMKDDNGVELVPPYPFNIAAYATALGLSEADARLKQMNLLAGKPERALS